MLLTLESAVPSPYISKHRLKLPRTAETNGVHEEKAVSRQPSAVSGLLIG
jgi:hypothetical protein